MDVCAERPQINKRANSRSRVSILVVTDVCAESRQYFVIRKKSRNVSILVVMDVCAESPIFAKIWEFKKKQEKPKRGYFTLTCP